MDDWDKMPESTKKLFKDNPELKDAWEMLYTNTSTGAPQLRKNAELLQNLSALIKNKKLANVDWAKVIGSVENNSLANFFASAKKLQNADGFAQVLADIGVGGNKYQGARFVVDYASVQSDEFIKAITKFEAVEDDVVSGIRRYDIQIAAGEDAIKLELKDWSKAWYSTSFRTQFLKDLQKMKELGRIQWKFKYASTVASDMKTLKEKVLGSLGTFNKETQKWMAGTELDIVSLEQVIKITSIDKKIINSTNKSQMLLDFLSDNINFSKIFEIIK